MQKCNLRYLPAVTAIAIKTEKIFQGGQNDNDFPDVEGLVIVLHNSRRLTSNLSIAKTGQMYLFGAFRQILFF